MALDLLPDLNIGGSPAVDLERLRSEGYIKTDTWGDSLVYGLGYERKVLTPDEFGRYYLSYTFEGYANIRNGVDVTPRPW